jgi:hypothetical protein
LDSGTGLTGLKSVRLVWSFKEHPQIQWFFHPVPHSNYP